MITLSNDYGIELKEKYGLDIEPKNIQSLDWIKFGGYMAIGWFGTEYNRNISWSDDGKQPENELLLQIGFPTGSYIFGDDRPVDLFKKFFLELKTYNPKYIDTANKCLYFSMDNAGKIFNEFKSILSKYNEINKEEFKKRRIEKIKEELKELETL